MSFTAVTFAGGIKEYDIYRDGQHVGTTTTTSFTDSGLEPSTEYTYQVVAVSNDGAGSELSESVTTTTLAA